jgi:hypothetical protein
LTLSGGNLAGPETSAATVTDGAPAPFSGSLAGWGVLPAEVGKFLPRVHVPGMSRPSGGSGIYLPKSNRAWGYFQRTTVGGRIELTVP